MDLNHARLPIPPYLLMLFCELLFTHKMYYTKTLGKCQSLF